MLDYLPFNIECRYRITIVLNMGFSASSDPLFQDNTILKGFFLPTFLLSRIKFKEMLLGIYYVICQNIYHNFVYRLQYSPNRNSSFRHIFHLPFVDSAIFETSSIHRFKIALLWIVFIRQLDFNELYWLLLLH